MTTSVKRASGYVTVIGGDTISSSASTETVIPNKEPNATKSSAVCNPKEANLVQICVRRSSVSPDALKQESGIPRALSHSSIRRTVVNGEYSSSNVFI